MRACKLLLFIILGFALESKAQSAVSITGYSCVTPGTPYQYSFNGGWDSTLAVQVCVTGGVISGESNTCKTANGLTTVLIIWNDSANTGSIQVIYGKNKIDKTIKITPLLTGGLVSDDKKTQFVDSTSMPQEIVCSQSKGGACDPGFSYQWQQSKDMLNWKDIPGANNKNLKFSAGVNRALYFRRRTKESNTGTVAYSDIAVVFVN